MFKFAVLNIADSHVYLKLPVATSQNIKPRMASHLKEDQFENFNLLLYQVNNFLMLLTY